jgi:signal transduction histidine kinase
MLKKIFYNKSIKKFNRITFFFAILMTFIFISLGLYTAYSEYQEDITKIENQYYNSQKEFVKQETLRALKFIKYKYGKNINNTPLKQLQIQIIDVIENMRNQRDGTGYIFIYTFDGVNVADPILKKNAGKNMLDFKDPNGKKVIKELINISKKPNGGYVKYVWNKPTTNTLEPKISYALSFEPWKWMVGSGVYIDEIEKVLRKRKKEYNKKIIIYIIQILGFSLLLFILGTSIYQYFTMLIKQDINSISKALNNHNTVDINKISFTEFRQIVNNINIMTKELKSLNTNLEDKVKNRTRKLKKSEKLTRKLLKSQDKFIKNAIHEINTPLSIIIVNIDLFKLKFSNNIYLSKIEAGSKIIHNIYNDLSYLVKKDIIKYKPTNIDFSYFLKQRIDFFDQIAKGNNLNIAYDIQDDIFIDFNDTKLQRICDNTLSNAIKYSYENTTIYIKLYQDKKLIFLEFKNDGNNIKEPQKLFHRYYRENISRGGFGIGLNIIKEICSEQNVQIVVKSKDNKTIFRYNFIEQKGLK